MENLSWAKNITEKLIEYELETDWDTIMRKTKLEWKNAVREAIEKKNKKKLTELCITNGPNGIKVNTKTKNIYQKLTSHPYIRKPIDEISHCNKQKTKTIILARSRMLECGTNFKGTMSDTCQDCNTVDDEHHRLNICNKWEDTNNANNNTKTNFDDIYSEDKDVLNHVINEIEKVWELKYANGRMKKSS